MTSYVKALTELYRAHADPEAALPMKAYMRNQFEYLGIKSPLARQLQKDFKSEYGLPEPEKLEMVLKELWALPEREYQYAALGILSNFEKKLPAGFSSTLEYLLTSKSWWDTVDTLAGNAVGTQFRRFPKERDRTLKKWRKSDDFWLRRTCILFQLKYKEDTDFNLLKEIIRENLGSKEFFINKAIGWALREHTRVNPEGVKEFVATTPLHSLSRREALKWLIKREQRLSKNE